MTTTQYIITYPLNYREKVMKHLPYNGSLQDSKLTHSFHTVKSTSRRNLSACKKRGSNSNQLMTMIWYEKAWPDKTMKHEEIKTLP